MYVYCFVEIKQNWTSDLTKALIIFRGELDAEFASKKKTHKSLWKQISEKLKMELDFSGDWLQCQSKFNKLTAKYKAVEDANKKSGERRRTMEFHSEMMVVIPFYQWHCYCPCPLKKFTSEFLLAEARWFWGAFRRSSSSSSIATLISSSISIDASSSFCFEEKRN